ncbi:dihydropteroate synthase, partial [Streptomyces nigra]
VGVPAIVVPDVQKALGALARHVVRRLGATLVAVAQVYRVHEVAETRQVLDMVATIAGHRPPAVARRGLA